MEKRNTLVLIAVSLGIIISLFLDEYAFNLASYINNSFFDAAFGIITNPAVMAAVMGIATILLFFDSKKRKWVGYLWASFIISLVLAFLLKLIVLRPRPSGEILYTFLNIISYSFPSMHAMAAFSILAILNKSLPRLKIAWISFALLYSSSRLYLGLHYFSDIVAGALFGYFIGAFMIYLEEKKESMTPKEFEMMIKEFEFRRKAFHTVLGIVLVALIKLKVLGKIELVFLIIAVIMLSMFSKKYRLPIIYPMLTVFEREKHLKGFVAKGLLFYLVGAFLSIMLFPPDIALASIIILALGDSTSHIFGVKFGKIKHPLTDKKFIEGTIAGILAGFLGALFFVSWTEALIASLIAMIAEGIELKIGAEEVDDNLVIPLVAGATIWFLRLF